MFFVVDIFSFTIFSFLLGSELFHLHRHSFPLAPEAVKGAQETVFRFPNDSHGDISCRVRPENPLLRISRIPRALIVEFRPVVIIPGSENTVLPTHVPRHPPGRNATRTAQGHEKTHEFRTVPPFLSQGIKGTPVFGRITVKANR